MIVRVILSFVALSFLISIPSLHAEQTNEDYVYLRPPIENERLRRSPKEGGPPGLNRGGGPPGWNHGGPPGSNRGGPPGLNRDGPPGWNRDKPHGPKDTGSSNQDHGNPTHTGCLLPLPPQGGEYQLIQCNAPCTKQAGDRVSRDSILVYSCDDSYVLRGNSTSICTDNTWIGTPICEKMCPPLESTTVDILCTYGEKTVSCSDQVKPGTRAKLSCKQSHFLPPTSDPAHRDLVCLENANWNRQVFACIPNCGQALHLSQYGNIYFPWYVGIYDKHSHDYLKHICGGSLISNNLVLSAAHCFYNDAYHTIEDSSRYYVAAGKYRRSWGSEEANAQKRSVEKIFLPERYMGLGGNYAQDIAILKLVEPFDITDFVAPVCVDWDNIYEQKQLQKGRVGKVTGWGMQVDGTYSDIRQEINVPYVSYNECLTTVPHEFRRYITSDKFCAGDLNGSNLCSGHSGGGLFFELSGLWYIRGIVSVNPQKIGTCNYHSYVGFTYISSFREWIRSIYLSIF